MNYFKNLFNPRLYLVLALILSSVLRLIFLSEVPPGVGGDELTYIITAKFMIITGSGIFGQWNPFSVFIFHYPHEFQAEISYFLLFPFLKFLPLSIITVKITFIILSVATVFIIYLIAREFFNTKTAVISAFIAAINPWSVFIGRTVYEVVPETFFSLLGMYLLLKLKGWKILWSIPIFALAFYSHIAFKIIFLPYVLILLFYVYFLHKKKYFKQYLIVGLFALFLTLFYIISIKTNPTFPRTSEVLTFNDSQIIKIVNQTRKATISNSLSYIFDNKFTVFANIIVTKFFNTLSPVYLFVNGDAFYGLYSHGLFYIVDFFFLLVGLLYAFLKSKRVFFLFIVLIILATVPHLLHTVSLDNFTPHITLLFPFFIILISYGISKFSEIIKGKVLLAIIGLIYLISLGNFLNIYFYEYPLHGGFDFKVRVLSEYLKNAKPNAVTVYSPTPQDYFKKYLFYTDSVNKNSAPEITEDYKTNDYKLGNIVFKGCGLSQLSKDVAIIDTNCKMPDVRNPYVSISRLVDGGEDFRIYNDVVCNKFNLGQYASNIKLDDLNVEKMSRENFCEKYITRKI